MLRRLKKTPWISLLTGLSLGLLVGVGMLIGALVTLSQPEVGFRLPEQLLHATATDNGGTMALATGPIDGEVEGLFILDFLTGELQCLVVNSRSGQLGGMFKHNVAVDLGVEQGKQPKYIMVTGMANFRTATAGNIRPAASIVYVADANTGNYAAYSLPWNRQAQQVNVAQFSPMVLIGAGSARQVAVE